MKTKSRPRSATGTVLLARRTGAGRSRRRRHPCSPRVWGSRRSNHYTRSATTRRCARPSRSVERASKEQHGFDAPGALPAEGGCTATVVNVSSDGLLTVKWVGDSRCVIQRRDGSVHALTRDHAAATHREEGLRIEKAGGAVEGAYVAAPRAEGLLQVTRSLGDRAHHL